jgi:NADP-dependent 3-hydroxy acid dehydrogenase YdfG
MVDTASGKLGRGKSWELNYGSSMELNDKVAVITGASTGIGAAIAQTLAARGVRVVLAARHRDRLERVAASLPEGSQSLVLPTDVSNEGEVRGMVDRTLEQFGGIDILVNNAGFGLFKPIADLTVEEFDSVIAVNLRGSFLCTKYVIPQMYRQGSGTIVTISSIAGKNGFSGGGAYCASKFGLMGLMESVFHEARTHNVRVVTITPGSVDTGFFDQANMTPPNRDRILQTDDVAQRVLLAVTLPARAVVRELDIRPANPRG